MFDDDNVTPVHSEDNFKLSGRGDWHCAYVCCTRLKSSRWKMKVPWKLLNILDGVYIHTCFVTCDIH